MGSALEPVERNVDIPESRVHETSRHPPVPVREHDVSLGPSECHDLLDSSRQYDGSPKQSASERIAPREFVPSYSVAQRFVSDTM